MWVAGSLAAAQNNQQALFLGVLSRLHVLSSSIGIIYHIILILWYAGQSALPQCFVESSA
jgi:hypothetical protein